MSNPTVIQVANELQLNQAIATVDAATTGSFLIQFTANITEGTDTGGTTTFNGKTLSAPADLYALNVKSGVSLTIDGGGYTLSGANTYRGLFAYSGAVTIENLNIDNTVATGGTGALGGGGGAGLGGGLFVGAGAQVTLSGVKFSNDKAEGGAGGSNFIGLIYGGGGGLGGSGGNTGGGGIGAGASGGGTPGSGIVLGAPTPAHRQSGSAPYGGGGKAYDGGGIGSTPAYAYKNSVGGNGGFGGGGGAGSSAYNPGLSSGGNGGFGGGGGAAYGAGGNGGFGGGGGAGLHYGYGGFGGGNGGRNLAFLIPGGGGGGLGAGGAIFVQQGGALVIGAGGISGGSVQGGAGGAGFSSGQSGSAFGSGIFVQGGDTLTFAPGLGQTLTISDAIADQSGSGGTGADAGSASVLIEGPGTVVLGGDNTYTGGTTVKGSGAILSISATDNLGAASSNVTLGNGTALDFTGSFTLTQAINVNGDPTFDVAAGQTVTVTAPIGDGLAPGDVVKTGPGTLALDAVDTYSSGTTIDAGTLELENVQGAGTGAIIFAPGAPAQAALLQIDGTTMPTNTIDGFLSGDLILLAGIANVTGSHADMDYATNVLTITEGANSYQLDFNPSESFAGDFFHLSSVGGGTEITENSTPCYCHGTLIRTPRGERRVETLAIGDEVITASGAARPIKWIGRRSYRGRFVVGRKDILPVCIKAGALAANVPARDLWISPHHAMYFEDAGGMLIEAKDLVNGVSIVQAECVDEVEYFHIELDTHDVVIAEGAASETFLDDDSRCMFHNAHQYRELYADETPPAAAHYCAPRLEDGYEIEMVRQRIAAHARASARASRIKVHRRAARH